MGTTVIGTLIGAAAILTERSLSMLALRLAEINSSDIRQSVSTGGSTTTLVDSLILAQPDAHWAGGTLWILSGGLDGTVRVVTASDLSSTNVTFALLPSAIAAGVNYSVINKDMPYTMLKMALNQALSETKVVGIDKTLVGVQSTYIYTLPAGVNRVVDVEFNRPVDTVANLYKSTHWKETVDGKLSFDTGFGPADDDEIWVYYQESPVYLEDDDDTIDALIELDTFMWLATEKLLRLLYHRFGGDQKQLPEWLADAIDKNKKGKKATRLNTPIIVHTSGW